MTFKSTIFPNYDKTTITFRHQNLADTKAPNASLSKDMVYPGSTPGFEMHLFSF